MPEERDPRQKEIKSLRERAARLFRSKDPFYSRLVIASLAALTILVALAAGLVYSDIRIRVKDRDYVENFRLRRSAQWVVSSIARIEASRRTSALDGDPVGSPKWKAEVDLANRRLSELANRASGSLATEGFVLGDVQIWLEAVSGGDQEKIDRAINDAASIRQRLRGWILKQEVVGTPRMAGGAEADWLIHALLAIPRLDGAVAELRVNQTAYLQTGDIAYFEAYRQTTIEIPGMLAAMAFSLQESTGDMPLLAQVRDASIRWQSQSSKPMSQQRDGKLKDPKAALVDPVAEKAVQEMDAALAKLDGVLMPRLEGALTKANLTSAARIAATVILALLAAGVITAAGSYSVGAYRRYAQEVEASEVQTAAIFRNALDSIVTFNDRGIIGSINPAAERMFAESAEDLVGKSINRLFPQRLLLHELSAGGSTRINTTANRQGYYSFPVEMSLSAIDVGRQRQYVAVIRDIAERKRSEEAIRQIATGISAPVPEDFTRGLTKHLAKILSADAAFHLDLTADAEPGFGTMTLGGSDEVRTVRRFETAETFCEEVLRRGTLVLPADAMRIFPDDATLGELKVESLVAVALTDARRQQVGCIGVLFKQPIESESSVVSTLQIFASRAAIESDRRRVAEEFSAERERLSTILRSMAEGFISTDAEGIVISINSVAERLTGIGHEAAVGKPLGGVLRILNERTGAVSQTAVQRILESGSAVGLGSRLTLVAADGSNHAVEMSASPIRDRMNRKIGIVMLLRDVTEKERLEDDRSRAEKLESLGVAAGGIAHDFNNLLTAILGNLALAMMEVDEETSLSTRLSTAKRACHRAQDLAQQLLTFAKGGAPVKKTASVRQLIEDTVRYALRDSRARCEFDIDPSLWSCEIDSGQIGQVVANLATNADQAMPGGGAIRIRCENYFVSDDDEDGGPALPLRAGRYVRISVEDEGIGIPSEYIAKIFDPYFTTKPKGSGLGLATAYSIVKNHDGHIGVESRTGSGTTFHVYLPASDREQPPSAAAAAPGRVPDASAATGRTGKRVLVMEDEEVICMLVEATLAPEGYEVLSAADGREGIKLYKEALAEGKPFDLIITDLTMPGGMGGLDAIKRLREIDPAVVAIVSSGYANDPVMSRYREYGFCGGIAKPYEVGELLNLVRSLTAPAADPIEATGD